ncbi:hypothetical protein JW905_01245 [bacterium]|nr:hypothetical protein [candidate division CSSED10-310 bacterium]
MIDDQLICSRCGEANPADVFFCRRCGMGLALVDAPGSQQPSDVDVRVLWLAGIGGGVAGIVLVVLVSFLSQVLARRISGLADRHLPLLLSVIIWRFGPLFFAVGSALCVHVMAGARG